MNYLVKFAYNEDMQNYNDEIVISANDYEEAVIEFFFYIKDKLCLSKKSVEFYSIDLINDKPLLLIEKYDYSIKQLEKSAKKRGFKVLNFSKDKVLRYTVPEINLNLYNGLCCFGTLHGIRHLIKKNKFRGYADFNRYYYTKYSSQFKKHLLNKDFLCTTFNQISTDYLNKNRFERLQSFFNSESIFIRPDSPFKPFTGIVLNSKNYLTELKYLESRCNPQELCIISPKQNILTEYRIITDGRKIITHCQYIQNDKIEICQSIPKEVVEYCEKTVLPDIIDPPDSLFVMDIASVESNGNYYYAVIEINALSTSGLYVCDMDRILDAIENDYKVKDS